MNCPKCQKLILLPSESPLPRKQEDQPPYQSGTQYEVKEITRAIGISVEPYRRDLETKSSLLNDAVEMVKVRNDRIKEIETLMLNTQKDLWALEVEHEEQSEALELKLRQAHTDLNENEIKLETALQTQHQLAEQNVQGEKQRKKLKTELAAALEKIESLEG